MAKPRTSGSSGGTWQTLADLDLAALPAADWKSGSHTLNGAALTFDRPTAMDVMGPDGSTGIVVKTTAAAASWTTTARGAPTWSVGLQDLVGVDLSVYRQIAVMMSANATAISANYSYWLSALETAAQPASAIALMHRMQWNGGVPEEEVHTLQSGTGVNANSVVASVPRSTLQVIDWRGKNVATYYDLAARTSPPGDIDDPAAGAWSVDGGDSARGHLYSQRAAYALATMRLTCGVGGWYTGVKSATFTRLSVQGLL